MIDNTLIATMFALSFGHFMPAMGMPLEMRIPAFLGTLVVFCVSVGFASGISLSFDLENNKLFGYHTSLPTTVPVVAIVYVLGSAARMVMTAVPVSFISFFIINDWTAFDISWLSLVLIVLLITTFIATLFLWLALLLDSTSFISDIWPRFIAPMFCFGTTFFTWHSLYKQMPRAAQWVLLNPMTHCVEGLRAALLDPQLYLSVWQCAGVLLISIAVTFVLYLRAVYKRLEPVTGKAWS